MVRNRSGDGGRRHTAGLSAVPHRGREGLSALAKESGFSFEPESLIVVGLIGGTVLGSSGTKRRAKNALWKHEGNRVIHFADYGYGTAYRDSHNHRTESRHWQSVIALSVPHVLPPFLCQPEGIFQKIGQLLGAKDIDFDQDPEFSRSYQLSSKEPDLARRVFDEATRAAVQACGAMHVEGSGNCLLVYRPESNLRVRDLPARLARPRRIGPGRGIPAIDNVRPFMYAAVCEFSIHDPSNQPNRPRRRAA